MSGFGRGSGPPRYTSHFNYQESQGHHQDKLQGQPQGNPGDFQQGHPQGYYQGQSKGYPQSNPSGYQGHSQGNTQSNLPTRGHSQGYPQTNIPHQDHSQGNPQTQGHSQGYSQGNPPTQGHSQGYSQNNPLTQDHFQHHIPQGQRNPPQHIPPNQGHPPLHMQSQGHPPLHIPPPSQRSQGQRLPPPPQGQRLPPPPPGQRLPQPSQRLPPPPQGQRPPPASPQGLPPPGHGPPPGFHSPPFAPQHHFMSRPPQLSSDQRLPPPGDFNQPFNPSLRLQGQPDNGFGSYVQQGQGHFNNSSSGNRPNSGPLINTGSQRSDSLQSDVDKAAEFIEKWLTDNNIRYRPKPQKDQDKTSISIPECHRLFAQMITLIKNQSSFVAEMKRVDKNCDSTSWEFNRRQIDVIQKEITSLKAKLNPELIQRLKKKLQRIKSKRQRLLKKSCLLAESRLVQRKERARRDEAIDKWREGIEQEVADKKMEDELKRSADKCLAEVRRKIADANKFIDVLKALAKLRELRKDAAKRKDVIVTEESDLRFQSKTKELEENMKDRLKVYYEEQRALQAMLDIEKEETKLKDQEVKRKEMRRKEERKIRDLRVCLFGAREESLDVNSPLYKCREFFESGEKSVESLIEIRRDWDQYIDDINGTPIPSRWLLPVKPSSLTWATFESSTA